MKNIAEIIPVPGTTELRIGALQVGVGDTLLRNQNEYPDKTDPMFNFIRGNVFRITKVTPGINADVVTKSGPYGKKGWEYGIPEGRLTQKWFVKLVAEAKK